MTFGELAFAGSGLLITAVLVLDLAGILNRGTGFRLQAVGLLVTNIALVVSALAHLHGHRIFPVLVVGFALFAAGAAVSFRKRRTAAG